jgi:uncharacterized protein YuzE
LKILYDKTSDMLSIVLRDETGVATIQAHGHVLISVDEQGAPVSIELPNAGGRAELSAFTINLDSDLDKREQ